MKKKVLFSTEAKLKNLENINYLLNNFNYQVLTSYLLKLEKIINLLEKEILEGNFDNELGLHKILITKQIYLFYEVHNNTILIVTIWNNYKKPYWL